MLTRIFSHIEGITPSFEKKLWDIGIRHWDDFFTHRHHFVGLPATKLEKIEQGLQASKDAFAKKDLHYFKNLLKPKDHWLLCHMGKIGYVDIETTGLSRYYEEITVIGIYDGVHPHLYVNGQNLLDAREKLKEFEILVTFNGKQFDMPFIEHHFDYKYDAVHLDLRYMLKELGLQGGLKNIEMQLGINRGDELKGIDGFEAVRLWHQYKRGNLDALQKLLRYNEQDIVNLKLLLQHYLDSKHSH